MSKITTALRVLLGLAFVVFSLNFFFHFLPQPPPSPEAMGYIGALFSTHLLTLIKVIELAAGLALLANRFVPLALALLAPILVGIVHFHATLAPGGLPLPLGLVALELALAWSYRQSFAPMLRAQVAPAETSGRPAAATAAAAVR